MINKAEESRSILLDWVNNKVKLDLSDVMKHVVNLGDESHRYDILIHHFQKGEFWFCAENNKYSNDSDSGWFCNIIRLKWDDEKCRFAKEASLARIHNCKSPEEATKKALLIAFLVDDK